MNESVGDVSELLNNCQQDISDVDVQSGEQLEEFDALQRMIFLHENVARKHHYYLSSFIIYYLFFIIYYLFIIYLLFIIFLKFIY